MSRAVSPVVGLALLALLTASLAGGIAVVVTDAAPSLSAPTHVSLGVSADETGRVLLEHRGGQPLNVTDLRIHVRIDGKPLQNQPPVPFFASPGFHGGPTGPFNSASDHEWSTGETATFEIAGTNEPDVVAGRTLTVDVYEGYRQIATAKTEIERWQRTSARAPIRARSSVRARASGRSESPIWVGSSVWVGSSIRRSAEVRLSA